jgi:hypothetical protein
MNRAELKALVAEFDNRPIRDDGRHWVLFTRENRFAIAVDVDVATVEPGWQRGLAAELQTFRTTGLVLAIPRADRQPTSADLALWRIVQVAMSRSRITPLDLVIVSEDGFWSAKLDAGRDDAAA